MALTRQDVYRRAYIAMRDHRAATAIDLRNVDGFVIVVSGDDYRNLLIDPPALQDTYHLSFDKGLTVAGIKVVKDEHLEPGQVRLRTEIEA